MTKRGKYELQTEIGKGGMGVVHAALNSEGSTVAYKTVRDWPVQDHVKQRFLREIEIGLRLTEPCFVRILDSGEDDEGRPFLVMEHLDGHPLRQVVGQGGPLPWDKACDLICRAARALQYAHDRGIVHRDVTPGNIFLTKDDELKLLDFGLGLVRGEISPRTAITNAGPGFGTHGYIAPEQAHDAHGVDHRADLYSLGCVFCFLLVGEPPATRPFQSYRGHLSTGVADFLHRLLKKSPDERFQSAAELVFALEELRSQNIPLWLNGDSPRPPQSWWLPVRESATRPEFRYTGRLYQFAGRRIPYLPLIDCWKPGEVEYRPEDIRFEPSPEQYQVPAQFSDHRCTCRFNGDKVRFARYSYTDIARPGHPHRLHFRFSKIKYLDHLQVGQYLDDPLPDGNGTFRDRYAPAFSSWEDLHAKSRLPNMCGVGVFLLTADGKVIVAQQSPHVSVYPSRFSYAASGTMDWGPAPDPFQDVIRECDEEINHPIQPEAIRLFGLGIDAKQFYFQFSFVERTTKESAQILEDGPHAKDHAFEVEQLRAIDFTPEAVALELVGESWEPAAGAALLTLCIKEFGRQRVEACLGEA